jgi:hypothetical protein
LEISEIKPGDVLFVWGSGPIDNAIELVTHGPSHCALFLDSDTLSEAQAGRTTGTSPITDYLEENDKRLEVWRDESLSNADRKKMVAYAKRHFGIHYDYLAILVELARFELDIPINSFHEGKRRICSSYVNDIARSANHDWSAVPYAPAPIDLLNSGKLTRKGVLGPWGMSTQKQNVL